MNSLKLDVLICTFGKNGILKAASMELPHVEGVRYVVSWQTNGEAPARIPEALKREDILIAPTDTIGSSNNRNHAISVSTAPVCLTADDDLAYTEKGLRTVMETFDRNPDLDLASFQYSGPDCKSYPAKETVLSKPLPKGFYSTSFEVAFRSSAVKGRIFYNPYFGINSPRLSCGDDNVFLLDCIKAGLNCRFFPEVITHHADLSSGSRLQRDPRFIMTQGAFIRYAYGLKGFPRLPLFVWRSHKRYKLSLTAGMLHILKGFFYKVPSGVSTLADKR